MRTIKIVKLKEVDKPAHRNNILPGYTKTGKFIALPRVGEPFLMENNNGTFFKTSTVVEIVSESVFRTMNSVYKIKINL